MIDYSFDQAIELAYTESPDVFIADLPTSWRVHRGPINGGLTVSVALKGLFERLEKQFGHPDPLVVSAFYLAAADPGPTEVRTEVIRSGRSMSTGQASVWQIGRDGAPTERLRTIATPSTASARSTVSTTSPPAAQRPKAGSGASTPTGSDGCPHPTATPVRLSNGTSSSPAKRGGTVMGQR